MKLSEVGAKNCGNRFPTLPEINAACWRWPSESESDRIVVRGF
jgi:hypothetical protein